METVVTGTGVALEGQDDDALIRRYVDLADRSALETLFRRHADAAYATAMRICRHSADAEDSVQTAMIKVMQNAASYRGGSAMGFRVWFMRIVVGSCKDRIRSEVRRRAREGRSFDESALDVGGSRAGPLDEDSTAALAKAVFEALNELPEHYRMPIWLHHYQGMSLKDAAAVLSLTENTVHVQLTRSMKKLRETLARRRVEASLASIAAALPAMRAESAPHSLLAELADVAAGKIQLPPLSAGAKTLSVARVAVRAAVLLLVTGGGILAYKAFDGRKKIEPVPVVAPAVHDSVSGKVSYLWNFNTSGIPAEFKVMAGSPLKYNAGEGPDKSGCVELNGSVVRVDVPVSFPFKVKFKSAVVDPLKSKSSNISTDWLPATDMARFWGAADRGPVQLVTAGQKYSAWEELVEYYSGTWIARWRGGRFYDVTVSTCDSAGRVSIIAAGREAIDDFSIVSISSNELPDVRLYLQALEKIPPEKRKGIVDVLIATNKKPASVHFFARAFENGGGSAEK